MNSKQLKKGLLSLDIFGEGIGFNINGEATHKSYVGLFFSIIIFTTMTAFGIKQFDTMINYEDTRHSYQLRENVMDKKEEVFNKDLHIGFTIVNQRGRPVDTTGYFNWQGSWRTTKYVEDSDRNISVENELISTHECSLEQFQSDFPDIAPEYALFSTCFDDLDKKSFVGTLAIDKFFRRLIVKFGKCSSMGENCRSELEFE